LWSAPIDAFVFAGDLVVAAEVPAGGGRADEVVGRERRSGLVRWRQPLRRAADVALGNGGRVVVVSSGRAWTALDVSVGTRRWSVPDRRRLAFAAPLDQNRLVVGDGRSGAVLDVHSGQVQRQLPVAPVALVASATGEPRLLALDGGRTVALDPATGVQRHAVADREAASDLAAGVAYTLARGTLSAYDLSDLRLRWSATAAGAADPSASLVYRGKPVLVHDGGRHLLAFR
jgi:outer membrane protein assembly factor BamB